MTTIMEMAQTVRDQEAAARAAKNTLGMARRGLRKNFVNIRDNDQVMRLCRIFGATRFELCRVIDKVGSDLAKVERQLQKR